MSSVGRTVAAGARLLTDPGEVPLVLPPSPRPLQLGTSLLDPDEIGAREVGTEQHGATRVESVLARHAIRSLVVLRDGEVVVELSRGGAGPADLHPCFSVTKSFTGSLVALAIHRGEMTREQRVVEILPELERSGFAGAKSARSPTWCSPLHITRTTRTRGGRRAPAKG